jgi:N-acetylmuramoyl-L-alanine amidase
MKNEQKRMSLSFFKMVLIALAVCILAGLVTHNTKPKEPSQVYSKIGSSGKEVEAIQKTLKDMGLFNSQITGYYGEITEDAVRRYQQQNGLTVNGIADAATLKKLGISIGTAPSATQANVALLARIISAEGRGESYEGQVAIGAVIMNRVEHPSFPDTLAGVIYQQEAFTAINDGQFNEPVQNSAYGAARDALAGWDPSGGAIYYYNPAKTSNEFIHSRPVIKVIGDHRFCS